MIPGAIRTRLRLDTLKCAIPSIARPLEAGVLRVRVLMYFRSVFVITSPYVVEDIIEQFENNVNPFY